MAFPSVETLTDLVRPLAAGFGMDVEGVKISRAGKKSVVAIALDSDQRPTSDQLEVITNEISSLFDAEEEAGNLQFGPGYTLEVGTPGVDAPLTLPRHWRRNRGRLVVLAVDGAKEVVRIGALSEDETSVIAIAREGKTARARAIRLADYPQAVVEIEFAKPAADELELAALDFDAALDV
ncbi:ribosome maturation factor RimP [Corynebacterium felinum]|uniref:Ribosome maturation factor RimP n=1 Tax=Corynebacterium felinum TaxID=131318 RepID=A0ABU2BBH2_9CORY|nr:ribosome maturation factor RimP [Corynebacterium felinum]MDF5819905.1 ribosome maturation factor RimP [Corynebacterium felinum]MDR7355951.1 ribosome maturation factor RimP [Corynebacterium felinum]WJY95289.1 Ribosome maturation factor RimP [Corynebacterium felinum]